MAEQQTLKDLIKELAKQQGLDLRGYKETTLQRRLQRRMQQLGFGSYGEYLEYFRRTPAEKTQLLNIILINVTEFFRDQEAWDYLAHEVLPALFAARSPGSLFKVWSAGCSSGEEAYSAAIMLSEFLGPRINDYRLKIYASDNDDQALVIARRGEYDAESLRVIPQEIRQKYFVRVGGKDSFRIARDLRKMVIFGRGDLLADAPISRVDLLICRNVLIYFDSIAQEHIVGRLRYALKEGGVLFLGKSESQLRKHSDMLPLNAEWRIFQKRSSAAGPAPPAGWKKEMDIKLKDKAQQDFQTLKLYYETLLSTLGPGILVMDSGDTVVTENENVAKFFDLSGRLVGKKLQDTELWQRCPELKQHLDESRADHPKTVRFEHNTSPTAAIAITIKPILSESRAGQVGTLLYIENVIPQVGLHDTIGELETTNEELQSTNEELETTNEELQSLNEELETTNEELSARTRELDDVNARYTEMMERMPWPVFLVNEDGSIYMFNSAAQTLFGFALPSARGMQIQELPLDSSSRNLLVQRHQAVVEGHISSVIKRRRISTNRFNGYVNVHLIPLSKGGSEHGVIVMFEPREESRAGNNHKDTVSSNSASKNRSTKKHSKPKKKTGR